MNGKPKRAHRLATTIQMMGYVEILRSIGLEVKVDRDAGTIDTLAKDGRPLMAIQKGSDSAPWIVTFTNTDQITWDGFDDGKNQSDDPAQT